MKSTTFSDTLMTTAARRGLLGGSRPWLVAFVLLVGGRLLRRFGGRRRGSVCISECLEIGDRIEIISRPPVELGR